MGRFSQRPVLFVAVAVIAVLLVIFGTWLGRRGNQADAAFMKLLSADRFHVVSELSVTLPPFLHGQERPFRLATIRVDGDVGRHSDRTPEFAGRMYLEARGRGNVFFADGEARILRDRVLFSLDNLPVFLNPSGSLVKRWTKVEASLLRTNNVPAVREALQALAGTLNAAGSETIDGERLRRYTVTLTPEAEQALADVLRRGVSGNVGLDVLARLLDANEMRELEVWITGGEVRRLRARFVRPIRPAQGKPREFDFATLTLTFSDYNKAVVIDAPEAKLSVQPRVFARLFGGGGLEEVKAEEEKKSNE